MIDFKLLIIFVVVACVLNILVIRHIYIKINNLNRNFKKLIQRLALALESSE